MPDDLDTLLRQLKQLGELRHSGALADRDYEEQVAELLAGGNDKSRAMATDPDRSVQASTGRRLAPATSRRRHPSGGSALIARPLGTSSNSSSSSSPAGQSPSPLARALEDAAKAVEAPDEAPAPRPSAPPADPVPVAGGPARSDAGQVDRSSSYWDRPRRVVQAHPGTVEASAEAQDRRSSYWARTREGRSA